MNFAYVAINSKYQKITGTISAEDSEKAKEQLHQMGFSVLEINEAAFTQTPQPSRNSNTENFWFLVRDQNGQKSEGTIESVDRKNAFRRLVSEYKFEVLALCPESVPKEDCLRIGSEGLDALRQEIEAELGIDLSKAVKERDQIEVVANKHFLEQRDQIMSEVEAVTRKAEQILEEYKEKISGEEFRSIKTSVDTLMRMKLSNNLEYIQDLAEELFEHIRQVLIKYESKALQASSIGEMPTAPGEDKIAEGLQGEIRSKALKNTLTLGSLRSISQRLSQLGGHPAAVENHGGSSIDSVPAFGHILALGFRTALTPTAVRRAELQVAWKAWRTAARSRSREPILPLILEEIRFLSGWLLGAYLLFFFIAEQLFLKGIGFRLPLLMELFRSAFLIFFTAFLFFSALFTSLWTYFLRHRPLWLLPIGLILLLAWSSFVANF